MSTTTVLPRRPAVTLAQLVAELIAVGLPVALTAQVWTLRAADRAFSTCPLPPGALSSIALYAARGEQEAAQIAVRSCSAEALTGPGATSIPASNILVRRAYNHPRIQVMAGDVELPPNGGTSYYDALMGNAPADLPGAPYHYSFTGPAGQAPGVYTGTAGALRYIYTPTLLKPVSAGSASVEILRSVGGRIERHSRRRHTRVGPSRGCWISPWVPRPPSPRIHMRRSRISTG